MITQARSGENFKRTIIEAFNELKENKTISAYDENVYCAHRGYTYERQYLANYVVTTMQGKQFIICSSNSYRSDRVKSFYYNLQGLRDNWESESSVIGYICIFSDREGTTPSFLRDRDRILNGQAYAPATHLFTLSEFLIFLAEWSVSESITLAEEADTIYFEQPSDELSAAERGSFFGIRGNEFERTLTAELEDPNLLISLNNPHKSTIAQFVLDKIIKDKGIDSDSIAYLTATNAIPVLDSGGPAKTDVKLTIHTKYRLQHSVTMSLKRTKEKRVSCHDYPFERFSEVLQCKGSRLEEYLKLFQEHGGYEKFEANVASDDRDLSIDEFKSLLQQHSNTFCEWVLMGAHDPQSKSPDDQVSQYILIRTPCGFIFDSSSEYLSRLLDDKTNYRYGVPFSWTYPSKQRGKRIQLKLPVLESQIIALLGEPQI